MYKAIVSTNDKFNVQSQQGIADNYKKKQLSQKFQVLTLGKTWW